MASFQANIGWKSMRKRENKYYHSDPFLPDTYQKIPKKLQKSQKIIVKSIWRHFQSKQGGQH